MVNIPNRREHIKIDSEVFGVPKGKYAWVHAYMDAPQKTWGKHHRRFNHTPQTCEFLASLDNSNLWVVYKGVYMKMAQAICLHHIHEDIEITKKRNAIAREKYQKEKKGLNTTKKKKKT